MCVTARPETCLQPAAPAPQRCSSSRTLPNTSALAAGGRRGRGKFAAAQAQVGHHPPATRRQPRQAPPP